MESVGAEYVVVVIREVFLEDVEGFGTGEEGEAEDHRAGCCDAALAFDVRAEEGHRCGCGCGGKRRDVIVGSK